MPDTTPERPVIGVRVHFNDTRPSVTHTTARKWYAETDGYLRVTDANAQDVAVHASIDWAWAELVRGEAELSEPAAPTINCQVTGGSCDPSYARSAPRLAVYADEVRLAAKLPIDTKHEDLVEEIESLRSIAENEGAR